VLVCRFLLNKDHGRGQYLLVGEGQTEETHSEKGEMMSNWGGQLIEFSVSNRAGVQAGMELVFLIVACVHCPYANM